MDRARPIGAVFAWGYGHYFIFAALAALGAGLQVAVDATHEAPTIGAAGVALSVGIPLAIYLGATAVLHGRTTSRRLLAPIPLVIALVLLVSVGAPWIGVPPAVVAMGLLVAALVAFTVGVMHAETGSRGSSPTAGIEMRAGDALPGP